VWIVFDALHFGRDVVLGATEIHHPVVVLVTTTLVTNRDVTVVVAAGLLELWLQQRRKTLTLVKVVTRNLDHATAAWRSWFDLDDSHDLRSLPGEVEFLTRHQCHIGLANVIAASHGLAEPFGFALLVEHG